MPTARRSSSLSRNGCFPTARLHRFRALWAADGKNRTAEFAEKGRRVGGGLKNGDLLIASKVRSIHFTDDGALTPQIVPCGLFVQLFRKKLREK